MPIYEYRCEACEQKFDKLIRSLNRLPETIHCPHCHSATVNRLISAPVIRTSSGEVDTVAADTSAAGATSVIGRKEIQAAQKKKVELKERAKYNDWD